MNTFHVNEDDCFMQSSTTTGNQRKYFRNNLYIKVDMFGYEGFAECLASELLKFIESDYSFADYSMCSISDGWTTRNGCYSENFLYENESLISLMRIIKCQVENVYEFFKQNRRYDLAKRTIELVYHSTNLDISYYLAFILRFDAIILNEDRHLNNISVIYNRVEKSYKVSPIFDNGLSLLSDVNMYTFGKDLSRLMKMVSSRPFSKDFMKQCNYFSYKLLRIDYDGFMESLDVNKDVYQGNKFYTRAVEVLLKRLNETEGILWERI